MDQGSAVEPIPVLLVTGSLGSGKTTLVNRLLRLAGERNLVPALVINEFGQLGIDGALVSGHGALYEINQGSLFCVCTRTSFLGVLADLADKVRPDLVIMEASGAGETADLEEYLDLPEFAGRFRLRANLCVVDAGRFTRIAPFLQSAVNQVQAADGILLNKCDLATDEARDRLEKMLRQLNPRAPLLAVRHGDMPWPFMDGLAHQPSCRGLCECGPSQLVAVSVESDKWADRRRLTAAFEELGDALLRLKGNVRFDDAPRSVEYAGAGIVDGAPIAGRPATAFTVIVWGLTREDVLARVAPAFHAPPA